MLAGGWVTVYALPGILWVLYFTYTSVSAKTMAKTQASGAFRNEYETVWYGKPLSDTAKHMDPGALEVIRRYDR